ncbi:MAG TPA: ComEC/Rec2 family competence protein, partial [Terriglobia bacterium]
MTSKQTRTQPEDVGFRLSSPALFLAGSFALGIVVAESPHAAAKSLLGLIPALIVVAALCLLAAAVQVRARREGWAAFAAMTGFVFAGAAAALLFSFRFPPHHVSHLESWGVDSGRPVQVEGVLVSDPLPTPSGPEFEIEATKLEQAGDERTVTINPASGKIRVRIEVSRSASGSDLNGVFEARSGDRIQALMRLSSPHVYYNPGSFDFRARAASIDDLYWEASVADVPALRIVPSGQAATMARFIETARGRLREAIDRLYPPWSAEGRDGAVLKAIVLGDRSSLDSATIDHFRASGLYHLLVIAGLHVGLIAALTLGLLRLLGLSARWRNLGVLVIMVAYAFL